MDLPANNWVPRLYQAGLWDSILEGEKTRAACVWHRRAGKDDTVLNLTAIMSQRRKGLYWHILPTYTQGGKVVWKGMSGDGRRFTDAFPPELVLKRREDKMMLELVNGSVFQVVGGDNPDSLRGPNPVGVVFSEYSYHDPECWNVIRPILNENGGWAVFIYTPFGHNHGYDLYQVAQKNPKKWFSEILTINDTFRPDGRPVITREAVEEEIAEGMPAEIAEQEYYCSFEAPLVGAVYGDLMRQADAEGRICDLAIRSDLPVYTSWDIGVRDSTVIWLLQIVDGWVHWIDLYASSGADIEHYAKVLQNRPYVYKDHWAPHDIKVREWGGGSRWEQARQLGLRFNIAPKMHIDDGINAVKSMLKRSKFNKGMVEKGINALKQYRREWDTKNRVWGAKPVHDWTSHYADAMRTIGVVINSILPSVRESPRFPKEETFNDVLAAHDRAVELARQPKGWVRI